MNNSKGKSFTFFSLIFPAHNCRKMSRKPSSAAEALKAALAKRTTKTQPGTASAAAASAAPGGRKPVSVSAIISSVDEEIEQSKASRQQELDVAQAAEQDEPSTVAAHARPAAAAGHAPAADDATPPASKRIKPADDHTPTRPGSRRSPTPEGRARPADDAADRRPRRHHASDDRRRPPPAEVEEEQPPEVQIFYPAERGCRCVSGAGWTRDTMLPKSAS